MSAAQIVQATYDVAHALNELKHDRHLIDDTTYQAVSGHLDRARTTVALIDEALALPPGRQDAALAAIRERSELSEASMLGADELRWPGGGRLVMKPRLAARLALALWAEARHGWHRLAGTYDTNVYDGARLTPA